MKDPATMILFWLSMVPKAESAQMVLAHSKAFCGVYLAMKALPLAMTPLPAPAVVLKYPVPTTSFKWSAAMPRGLIAPIASPETMSRPHSGRPAVAVVELLTVAEMGVDVPGWPAVSYALHVKLRRPLGTFAVL